MRHLLDLLRSLGSGRRRSESADGAGEWALSSILDRRQRRAVRWGRCEHGRRVWFDRDAGYPRHAGPVPSDCRGEITWERHLHIVPDQPAA